MTDPRDPLRKAAQAVVGAIEAWQGDEPRHPESDWAERLRAALASSTPDADYAERLALADSFAEGLVAGVNAEASLTPDALDVEALARIVWSATYNSMRDEGVTEDHAMARADVVRIEFERAARGQK